MLAFFVRISLIANNAKKICFTFQYAPQFAGEQSDFRLSSFLRKQQKTLLLFYEIAFCFQHQIEKPQKMPSWPKKESCKSLEMNGKELAIICFLLTDVTTTMLMRTLSAIVVRFGLVQHLPCLEWYCLIVVVVCSEERAKMTCLTIGVFVKGLKI